MFRKSVVLKQIRIQCEKGVRYTEALKNIYLDGVLRKISYQTLENWRNERPMIERYITTLMQKRDAKIDDAVENKFIDRLLKGEASPVEYMFFLCNRKPHKWQHKHQLEYSGKIEIEQVEKVEYETLRNKIVVNNN